MSRSKSEHWDSIIANSSDAIYERELEATRAEQYPNYMDYAFRAGKYAQKLEDFNREVEAFFNENPSLEPREDESKTEVRGRECDAVSDVREKRLPFVGTPSEA